jgi:hypothetical protein
MNFQISDNSSCNTVYQNNTPKISQCRTDQISTEFRFMKRGIKPLILTRNPPVISSKTLEKIPKIIQIERRKFLIHIDPNTVYY